MGGGSTAPLWAAVLLAPIFDTLNSVFPHTHKHAASVGDSDGIHAKAHFVKNELNNTVD